MVWRSNTSNLWVDYQFGGAANRTLVPLKTANRIVAAQTPGGSIAAFPPPHNFFWARESDQNLGYSWYRKDPSTSPGAGTSTFAFGIRQAENEERENIRGATLEGLNAAARKGNHGGRPPVITEDMLHTVLRRRARGESIESIRKDLIIPTGKRKGRNPGLASIYRAWPNTNNANATPRRSNKPTPSSLRQ